MVETGGLENVPTYLVLPIFSRLAFAQSVNVGTFGHIRQRVCNRVCNRSDPRAQNSGQAKFQTFQVSIFGT